MLKYLLREIFAEKLRVFLTMAAISWGTLSIALMLASGQGMLVTMTQYIEKLGSNLLVISGGETSHHFHGGHRGETIDLKSRDLNAIRKLPDVVTAVPQYDASSNIYYGANVAYGQDITGVPLDYTKQHHITVQKGRFLNGLDQKNSAQVIVLGTEVVKNLFNPDQAVIGSYVKFNNLLFKVVGIAGEENQIFSHQMPDKYFTWIPASTFKKIFKVKTIDNILLTYKNPAYRNELKEQIRAVVAIHHQTDYSDQTALRILDNAQMLDKVQAFFTGVQFFLGFVGVITLLVAALGVANVMYVTVQRASKEIGIRMACGAKPIDIVKQYMLEAILVTLIGGGTGIILAYGIISVANVFLKNVTLFTIKGFHMSLSWQLLVIVTVILTIIGIVAGFFPALRAARIQPVEVLRHE